MIYVPFIYFSFLFLVMWKKQGAFNIGSVIILFYIISSFFAILIKENNLWNQTANFPKMNVLPTFLYCSLITLAIIPFSRFRSEKIKAIKLADKHLFVKISWILMILIFISLAITLPGIIKSLSLNFIDIRKDYYQDSGTFYEFSGTPWYQLILNFAPSFSPILLLFFFYSTIYMDNKRIFNILLLLSSFVLVLSSILSAARTQVIYWIMTFSALYVCFRPQMKAEIKKKINILFVIIGSIGLIYMFAVTISRFEHGDEGAGGSLILYAGQSYPQFCNVYNHYTFDGLTIDRILPITSKYILGHRFSTVRYRDQQTARINAETGVFFTFLGDAMLDLGKFGMVIYTLIFYFIASITLKRNKKAVISLSQMIVFVLLMRMPLLGLFAYMYSSIQSSIMIIGSLIMAFLIKYKIMIK